MKARIDKQVVSRRDGDNVLARRVESDVVYITDDQGTKWRLDATVGGGISLTLDSEHEFTSISAKPAHDKRMVFYGETTES